MKLLDLGDCERTQKDKKNQNWRKIHMSENCTHDCNSCGESCSSRNGGQPTSLLAPLNPASSVKHVIGVVSGKGGVGKSLVTALMAVKINEKGKHTAILDADITGPSIPKAFGLGTDGLSVTEDGMMVPATTATGIDIMSANLLLDKDTDPVIWRGPVIAGTVKQFWSDVVWGDLDYLFVDMPPGTGDVPLTVFQSLPVDGIVIVTSPQELVQMIVKKAYNMAGMMNIPVLGVVENYSYLKCPDCGKEIKLFGESHIDEVASELAMQVLGKMPLDPAYAELADAGLFYKADNPYLEDAVKKIENM